MTDAPDEIDEIVVADDLRDSDMTVADAALVDDAEMLAADGLVAEAAPRDDRRLDEF